MDKDEYQKALIASRLAPPDLATAYDLLLKAAEKKDNRAIYALATWNLFGNELVPKDEKMGIAILKSLRRSFVAEALFDLAVSYDYGRHVRKSDRRAFSLYMQAALLGERESCCQVAQFYEEGKIVERDIQLAVAWRKRASLDEKEIAPPYREWLD